MMDIQTKIFKRFRSALPYSVSSDTIMVVLHRCIDRILESHDKKVAMLLEDDINVDVIDYGALNQSFEDGQVIRIHINNSTNIKWEFDPETGEWLDYQLNIDN